MNLQERISSLIIDVKGTTKTTRHTFSQNSFGKITLDTKKVFDNVDFDLKVNKNTRIKLPLDIKADKTLSTTIINSFELQQSNSKNLYASVDYSDTTHPTIIDDHFMLLKPATGSHINKLIVGISDSKPEDSEVRSIFVSYPVIRNIVSGGVDSVLSMNLSDTVKKRFFIFNSTIPLNVADQTPTFSFVNNFVLRPFNSYPDTPIILRLPIEDERRPEDINLNYYKLIKYNSNNISLLNLDIEDKIESSESIGGLTHTMKFASDDSITLSMRVQTGNISYQLATLHALSYAGYGEQITIGLSIFDWMRTPTHTYRYQNWLDS